MTELVERDPNAPVPWERLPGESSKAYAAFIRYRDLPTLERSIRKLAEQLDRGAKQLAVWSSQHSWVARAEAYDEHRDRVALAAQDARIAELAALRADFAVDAMVTVLKRLRGDEGDPEQGVAPTPALDASKLTAKDIAALAGAAEKVGASFDRVAAENAQKGDRDISLKLSFDLTPHHGPVVSADDVVVHAEIPRET